ncbi:MAG: hypothetical protein OCD02_22215 [Spirochaetaceae bacterium]
MEDFKIFKTVQIKKYCTEKKCKIKTKTPEWDMINDLIIDYWSDLIATGYINNKTEQEKVHIFSSLTIIFPYTTIPSTWLDGIDYVDFKSYQI